MHPEAKVPARLLSLDALRGFTIAAMILVNFPGNEAFVYPPLRHSTWNGLTFTDFIAPVFLFVVGVSIVLAFSRRRNEGTGTLHRSIIVRAFKIFAVGMFLNLLPDFNISDLRYTGTLHRIAIVFLVCSLLFLHTSWKQQAWTGAGILVGYWLAMTTIPTPGMGRVVLEPGQNLAAWVDQQILPGKMWQGNWDPEGILSTFPTMVTCICGMLTGRIMLLPTSARSKSYLLTLAGAASCIAGCLWALVFPINENLWTSSFVLVTAGFASILLAVLHFIMDIKGKKRGAWPGLVFGANAIAVYVMADLLALVFYMLPIAKSTPNLLATDALILLGFDPRLASMLYALFFVGANFVAAWILYVKKIFIKL